MTSPEAHHEPRDFHAPDNLETERSVDALYERTDAELFDYFNHLMENKDALSD